MGNGYEHAMMFKNTLIFFAGFLLGIILLAVLGAIAMVRNQSRKYSKDLTDASFVKIVDGDNQHHLVFNIKTFTQAFFYIFANVWYVISPFEFKVLYHNRKREIMFFVIFCIVAGSLLYLSLVGIIDITYEHDGWQKWEHWYKIDGNKPPPTP